MVISRLNLTIDEEYCFVICWVDIVIICCLKCVWNCIIQSSSIVNYYYYAYTYLGGVL